jgi:hypothetical protein
MPLSRTRSAARAKAATISAISRPSSSCGTAWWKLPSMRGDGATSGRVSGMRPTRPMWVSMTRMRPPAPCTASAIARHAPTTRGSWASTTPRTIGLVGWTLDAPVTIRPTPPRARSA